jgi:hypothetical protein
MSKILILTASPVRDLIVDTILAEELQKMGHETSIRPCLREGRDAVMEFMPDVIVVPPIRNPYSRDLVETIKHFGMGIVSRHTEPSCDWKDFNKMPQNRRHDILGQYGYFVDAEIVWSKDEAEILSTTRPGAKFPIFACGAFTVDAYKRQDIIEKHRNKEEFCIKHNLDPGKKNLLITSPWGFADTAPDLHIDQLDDAKKDIEGRGRHFEMIRYLVTRNIQKNWNVIVTIHPGVFQEPYRKLCDELQIPLDTETNSFDLKVNVDGIIHAGSTMSIGAHFLGIPAWQYGDMNAKDSDSWWGDPESDISKVSPYFKKPSDLYNAIIKSEPGSNANMESIKALENGRYGAMDGKATKRAADVISKTKGKFAFRWPKSTRDYSQLRIRQNEAQVLTRMNCAICKESFIIINESYLKQHSARFTDLLKMNIGELKSQNKTAEEILDDLDNILAKTTGQSMLYEHNTSCPHCSARFFVREQPSGV